MKYLLEKLNSLFLDKDITVDIQITEEHHDHLDYYIINIKLVFNNEIHICRYRSTDSIHQIITSLSIYIDNLLEK